MNKLVVSPSPHVHSGNSIQKEMKSVLIALIPAYLVALYYFGVGALIVSATSVLSCVLFEYLIQKFILKGEKTITDCSAIVTGLLLAFNLPSNLPIGL
jgi:electron transport complex protein RnfD